MHLVIDIGNTRTKLVWFKKGKTFASLNIQLNTIRDLNVAANKYPFASGIIASVKKMKPSYINWAKKNNFIFLSQQSVLPIKNLYATPNTLGNDRLAAVT